MLYSEFVKLAGYEVLDNDYNEVIEPMYMATDLSKSEFVKCLDRNRFDVEILKDRLITVIKFLADELYTICGHSVDLTLKGHFEDVVTRYTETFCTPKHHWVDIEYGYEYPENRGCRYPAELVVYDGNDEIERIKLV